MSITRFFQNHQRQAYRFFTRTKALAKYATYGAVIGATVGAVSEISTRNSLQTTRPEPIIYALLGAGYGLIQGYFKEIPELGDIPILPETSQNHSGRVLKPI